MAGRMAGAAAMAALSDMLVIVALTSARRSARRSARGAGAPSVGLRMAGGREMKVHSTSGGNRPSARSWMAEELKINKIQIRPREDTS